MSEHDLELRIVSHRLERTLLNDLRELPGMARDVRAYLLAAGIDQPLRYAVDLALEELVSNTIRYGYGDVDQHEIRVQVTLTDDEVRVTIEDDAAPFDPTRMPEPPRPTSLADAPAGGRGILMVRRMIDDMRYQRADGRNTLTLVLPRKRGTESGQLINDPPFA